MDRPSDSQKPVTRSQTKHKNASYSSNTTYLIIYNSVSAILWSGVLGGVLYNLSSEGVRGVYPAVGEYTKWVQTLAGLEIIHSLIGLVRAPVLTTIMQVASRFLLVWGITDTFRTMVTNSILYSAMLLAWSTTEVIRYSYFAVNLANGKVPAWLTWLRYNAFFVLYPLGISSECALVNRAREPARKLKIKYVEGEYLEWALIAVLLIYVPGSYILFTHMMAQRRKVMRGSSTKKRK